MNILIIINVLITSGSFAHRLAYPQYFTYMSQSLNFKVLHFKKETFVTCLQSEYYIFPNKINLENMYDFKHSLQN